MLDGETDCWLAENLDEVGERSTVDLSGLVPQEDGLLTGPLSLKRTDLLARSV